MAQISTYINTSLRAKRSNPEKSQIDCHVAHVPRNDGEYGNALIFILIAITLLGLLTVTLSRSGDSTNETGSFEQNQIAISQLLSQVQNIENGVQSLLAKGCSENQISFDGHNGKAKATDGTPSNFFNNRAPSDESCHVFSANGAGLLPPEVNSSVAINPSLKPAPTLHSQSFAVTSTKVDAIGTERPDLLLWLGSFPNDFCMHINQYLGVTNLSTTPPEDDFDCNNPTDFFTGTHNLPTDCTNPLGNIPELTGQQTYCVKWPTSNLYNTLYHVLHAR